MGNPDRERRLGLASSHGAHGVFFGIIPELAINGYFPRNPGI
jgi:hypothetical protein